MIAETTRKAVNFHLDRMRDHTVQIIKAVVDDPRLEPDERIQLLMEIIHEHVYIVTFLEERVRKGLCLRNEGQTISDT
ncbi:MAG: hypothetical protein KDD62_04120 [Bdellovibrionales bacterium]|nr:hypothetical protein [Bdellovibrionales bacterium]